MNFKNRLVKLILAIIILQLNFSSFGMQGEAGVAVNFVGSQAELNAKLFTAVIDDNVTLVEALLYQGANPDAINEEGQTALFLAADKRTTASFLILERLLTKGANPNLPSKKGDIFNRAPLDGASWNGFFSKVYFLLAAGAEVNHADSTSNTALMWAANNELNFKVDDVETKIAKLADILSSDIQPKIVKKHFLAEPAASAMPD